MSIESDTPSNYLILCHPLLFQPSIFPTIRVFSNESALHIRWTMCWSFSSSINPSSEYWRLISLRIDWFDLLAVQGTLKRLFQHHSSKASILQCSAFSIVQLKTDLCINFVQNPSWTHQGFMMCVALVHNRYGLVPNVDFKMFSRTWFKSMTNYPLC